MDTGFFCGRVTMLFTLKIVVCVHKHTRITYTIQRLLPWKTYIRDTENKNTMERLSHAHSCSSRDTSSCMIQQLDNESRRNAFLNEATFEKEWLEFESKNGIYEEFIRKKNIIDRAVKTEGMHINVNILMVLIDNVTLKNMRCAVWCMIVCCMLRELVDMLSCSENEPAEQEMTRLIKQKLELYDKNHIHEIAGLTIHDIDIQVAEISRKIQEIDYNLQYRKHRHTLHFEVLAKVSVFIQSIEYMTTVTIQ